MRTFLFVLLIIIVALPAFAAVQTWKNVTLVDAMCADKVKANPDAHTTECALQCRNSGLGIVTSDGSFLKFDAAGSKQAVEVLKATKKKDHLRATVVGEQSGDSIKVQSVKLD
jgi:hypothetical protein